MSPGFVDLHVHLREPGKEEAETIETGSRAAALGGFTAIVAMPNTDPTQDCVEVVDFVRRQGVRAGLCEVLPAAAITVGRHGDQLAPFAELAAVGVRIFTDDGNGVQDPLLMRRAFEYSLGLDITLAQHCEVARLTEGAVMHEGSCCSRFGLPGWPSIAEELMVHRDIELVRLTGARAHFLHLSTAGSVALVACGEGRRAARHGRGGAAPLQPHRRAPRRVRRARSRSTRRCGRPATSPRCAPDSPTGRSTRSPPTTPRMPERRRNRPLDQAPPGHARDWRRRSACRWPISTCRSPT